MSDPKNPIHTLYVPLKSSDPESLEFSIRSLRDLADRMDSAPACYGPNGPAVAAMLNMTADLASQVQRMRSDIAKLQNRLNGK